LRSEVFPQIVVEPDRDYLHFHAPVGKVD